MSMLPPTGPNPGLSPTRNLFQAWMQGGQPQPAPLVQPAPLAQGPTAAGAPNIGGGGFNPAAAGIKVYGAGDFAPQRGKIGLGMQGYAQRDALQARQAALGRVLGGNGGG